MENKLIIYCEYGDTLEQLQDIFDNTFFRIEAYDNYINIVHLDKLKVTGFPNWRGMYHVDMIKYFFPESTFNSFTNLRKFQKEFDLNQTVFDLSHDGELLKEIINKLSLGKRNKIDIKELKIVLNG